MVERMIRFVATALSVIGFALPAWADETAAPASPCPDAQATMAPSAPTSLESEEKAFDRDFAVYSERRAFTERLVKEREARAFEEEQARYLRFRALTLKLGEDAARAVELDFERAVELYLAKVRLTRELAAGQTPTPIW